ncbi:MAG: glutamate-5-semialdehyde dehydrogenase [Bacteroidaceae bacterium]|nr:glutamate-5-semialdehyde dehydrogenase [Bacteroidaceae bacterium]
MNQDFANVRDASRLLGQIGTESIDEVLLDLAKTTEANAESLLEANALDLQQMDMEDPRYDRLQLTKARLQDIANDLRHVAELPSPLGKVLRHNILPNGLELTRVSVPFGVIGIIFEARPNVCFDCFALCLKAGSACILKGGSDAEHSCRAIVDIIHEVLNRHGLPSDTAMLLTSHEDTDRLLTAQGLVDLIIPRGSSSLIEYVRDKARVPVIETGAGVVHCYIDRAADLEKAKAIVLNAKTRRVSVCNALDCLIVHRDSLFDLREICRPLLEKGVVIEADEDAYSALLGDDINIIRASETSFGTEFLSLRMAIKTVASIDEAIAHIQKYGSGHSESIVTEDAKAASRFLNSVDAACVYHNAPTSFTDGAQFGLGAEIGISTQKLHARGPMALEEITTYKWIIRGNGQTRK